MEIKLISYSQTPEVCAYKSPQELVAFCARVSNPENQNNYETSERLIKYLIMHKHWSPLEMVSACFEVTTTRDSARQMLRHRSFSFQEFSQRYAVSEDFVVRECRFQDDKNRQNSIELDIEDDAQRRIAYQWEQCQKNIIAEAKASYQWALANGIAKEQARAILPEGLTVSRLYMNGTLRSWVHYVELRSENGTQKEHADIALGLAKILSNLLPVMSNS